MRDPFAELARAVEQLEGQRLYDRVRDRALHAAGWTVVRITSGELDLEPDAVKRDLECLLGG